MATAKGIGELALECPQRHHVGRLVKQAQTLPAKYASATEPGNHRDWPPPYEPFRETCDLCKGKPVVGADTAKLQKRLDRLLADEFETKDTATLPYLPLPAARPQILTPPKAPRIDLSALFGRHPR
jgi:hypothetical protein